ncbi:MAG: hypothetical protein ACTSWQ_03195 [Candidatus Thorarchaeota archaeon]
MTDFPKGYKNPTDDYLAIEKKFKGDRKHIQDEQTLSLMLFKGFRLTRNEFSNCVSMDLIINTADTDKAYDKFMSKWKETETQFRRL